MNEIKIEKFIGSDDLETFRNASEYLRENPGTSLLLEPKTYIFSDEKAKQLQDDVLQGKLTNNPESIMFKPEFEYITGFDLSGVKTAKICGNGAKIMVDGFMEPIALQNCSNIELCDITIDHIRKPYSKGVVIGSGEVFTDVDFKDLAMIYENMPSPRIITFDHDLNRFTQIYGSDKKELLKPGVLRFFGFSHKKAGDDIYVMNTFHSRPAILIYAAKNSILTNVTINSQPGMGIVGHRSKNIKLNGVKIIPSKGEAYSTNTDATHFVSCSGDLTIESCLFDGHGDDATNVHTYYYTISENKDCSCILSVEAPTYTHSQKLDYPDKGDILELSLKENLAPFDTFEVVSCKPEPEKQICTVTLNKNLPENCEDLYLANTTKLPHLVFKNNIVKNHLARTVLVKTRNVLIENNDISYSTGTAIHIAAEGYWHEGITSQNVVIRNNRIHDCGINGHGRIYDAGGISINISSPNPTLPVHKNILIENNEILCPDTKHAIYAANVSGLTIKNNNLLSAEQPVIITNCENIISEG